MNEITQIGMSQSIYIFLANISYLPMKPKWNLRLLLTSKQCISVDAVDAKPVPQSNQKFTIPTKNCLKCLKQKI